VNKFFLGILLSGMKNTWRRIQSGTTGQISTGEPSVDDARVILIRAKESVTSQNDAHGNYAKQKSQEQTLTD
jgi:hypothetical protein